MSPSPRWRYPWLPLAIALVLAVCAVYWPVRAHGWVSLDDPLYLLENPHVARGLDGSEIRWVFGHPYAANYHPLTWVSHMLDVEWFGLEPRGHHLVNVALHALNSVLVLLLLRELCGSPVAAGLGAALFALHPLRVESVAWASERKDVLCALFYLATLLLYLRDARSPSRGGRALVALGLLLALLAKPMAVTLPAVALLLDRFPLERWSTEGWRRLLREKVPLFALAALGAGTTWLAQESGGSTSTLSALPLDVRFLNALAALKTYLAQTLWPTGLAVFYPHPGIVDPAPARALLFPALVGAALLAGIALYAARRPPPVVLVGWLAFLVLLAPVIGLVQVGTQAHADRYTYLPSVFLLAALMGTLDRLGKRVLRPLAVLGLLSLPVLAAATRRQLAHWRDSEALFQRALAVTERNYVAHLMLGKLALEADDLERAAAGFERALEIHPRFPEALNNLALCHLARGDLARARALLERAQLLDPGDYDTLLNLGVVALEGGELATARKYFEACRSASPGDPAAHFNLGNLAVREGRDPAAEDDYRAALERDPEHADAWSNLGQVLLRGGRRAEAVAAFERVVALEPQDPLALFNLGIALRDHGQLARARAALQRALLLDPELDLARQALAGLAAAGQ